MSSEKSPEETYLDFLKVVMSRGTCRNFSPKPIPEGYVEKILEAARWAPSGANAQPWSFIVIRSPEIRKKVFDAYCEIDMDLMWWTEQMRCPEYRHPGYAVETDDPEKGLEIKRTRKLWSEAPVIICVAGDGRKQWASVQGGHTFGLDQTHLTDGLSNASLLIHLAAASLGLTSQWMTIHTQGPFKEILGVPDPLILHTFIPIGYEAGEKQHGAGWREKLDALVHEDVYDMSKHLSNRETLERLGQLRKWSKSRYKPMIK